MYVPKEKDQVRYVGANRPQLKGLRGVVQRVSGYNNSALVDFYDDMKVANKLISTEWVGAAALEQIQSAEKTALDMLKEEFSSVSEEYAKVSKRYNELSARKLQLSKAIEALTTNSVYR